MSESKIPVGRMVIHEACLRSLIGLLKELAKDNEIAASILLKMNLAADLMTVFNKTWDSIHWNKERKKTRDRIMLKLKNIAIEIIDHVEESMTLFDELCEEQEQNPSLELNQRWIAFQARLGGVNHDLGRHKLFVENNSIEELPLMKLIKQ